MDWSKKQIVMSENGKVFMFTTGMCTEKTFYGIVIQDSGEFNMTGKTIEGCYKNSYIPVIVVSK